MSIRVSWRLGLMAVFTLCVAASSARAQGMGHGIGGTAFFGRFGFGGPAAAGPIAVVSSDTWEINNATGTAGPTTSPTVSGWSLIQVNFRGGVVGNQGDFYWDASPTNKLSFSMVTLTNPTEDGQDTPTGPMANFNPNVVNTWSIITFPAHYLTQDTTDYPSGAPTLASILNASTSFDFSGFANLTNSQIAALNTPGNPSLGWNLLPVQPGNFNTGGELDLIWTPAPVPEPGTLVLTALGLAGVWRLRRACAPFAQPRILGGDA